MESMEATPAIEQTPKPNLPPPSSSSTSETQPSPNPNPNSNSITPQNPNSNSITPQNPNLSPNPPSSTPTLPQPQQQHSQIRPQQPHLNRPPRQQTPYSTFSSPHMSSLAVAPSSSSLPGSTPMQRGGGLAIGVPAHQVRPSTQPATTTYSAFGASYNQGFGGLGRNPVAVADSGATPSATQVKQPIQGIQTIGMAGSISGGSQMRPSGISQHHQQRAMSQQTSVRSQPTSNNQTLANQKYQNHGLLRMPAVGSPGSPSPGTSQGLQTHQPWMTATTTNQGKQMHPPSSLTPPSYRPQMKSQSLQQRSHYPLQTALHQQMPLPQPQAHPLQEHFGQPYPPPRLPQSMPQHQQQAMRGLGPGNQKTSTLKTLQSAPFRNTTAVVDTGGSSNQILSKRSIHELVTQIDPSEKLDPDVQDILVEIAEDFVESITTFACSFAKHRKSNTLEAKDILLHLEKNWNIALPGFGGDEIKSFKKPFTNDIHKERLAAIKKSAIGNEVVNIKSSAGQTAGNVKGHAVAKMPSTSSP
ncbi:hypothetical protein GIB67_012887 [Kingdonia uniflora]|uniref:Transcription initiation factor TFIID subunit 12 domain-containing protein n=1 Tax=Kingdonia uniflora TaxID=39325 RepID=A0A7J7NG56_9MAGN|nr:hypothetical protein GIB67_012887 [Kingdonia uniflora]